MKIKRFIYASLMIAFSGTLSVSMTGCKKEANELAHNHSHHNHEGEEHEHEHGEGHVHGDEEQENKSGAHASDEIIIEQERAAKLGVTTSKATPGEFFETVAVGGELSSAPSNQSTVTARSAGIVSLTPAATPGAHVAKGTILATISGKGMAGGDANEAARVALTAAKRELDRLTPLHADGIVSTRDYNAAKQAYEAAKAAAGNGSAGGSTAVAPTSGTITQLLVSEGQYVDAGAPIAVVAGSSTLTLRANLPEREVRFLPTINGAKVRTSYSDQVFDIAEFNGRRSSDVTTTVATQGYIPVYFTLTNNGTLSAGSYCEIYLTGNKRDGVIALPTEALSEQQGEFFVYVRIDDEGYEKRPVKLGASSGDTVEILSGVNPGDEVVTTGTTFVRLAESSGVVPEGHSHNH